MSNWLVPCTLTGELVELIPLQRAHREALLEAAADGHLWELWYTSVPSANTIDTYLTTALNDQEAGRSLPFVVVHRASGEIIGTTRYCRGDAVNRRLEIGYTWYAQRFQRTGVNTECKFLLLRHAFEALNCIAVEFRTHWHNHRSRRAIARLGARQDGVLRNHRLEAGGGYRDTVVFSITEAEWPTVKKGLAFQMKARQSH